MKYISLLFFVLLSGSILSSEDKTTVRVGFFPNLTHAQALIGKEADWFRGALGDEVEIEWYVFQAGPSAMESLLTGTIDLAYVGPNPAINAYMRSEGKEVRIVAGACSGGSALVVRQDSGIKEVKDFKGKRIATPQLGGTQDIAARTWLQSKGFRVTLTGGDVTVIPTANPDQIVLFRKGNLDGAWTIEPWVSRLQEEAGGRIFLEEKSLWPETGGRYVTTQLVSSVDFLENHPDLLKRWIQKHVELTDWMKKNEKEAKSVFNRAFAKITRKALPDALLEKAWGNLEFTYDPIPQSLFRVAEDSYRLGLLPKKPDLQGIYRLEILKSLVTPEVREPAPQRF